MNKIAGLLIVILYLMTPDINIYAQTPSGNKLQKQSELQERRRTETQEYEKALNLNTIKALTDFLKKYPDSMYKHDVKDRIAEFELWAIASYENTYEAYSYYLDSTSMGHYMTKAKEAIKNLQAIEKWEKLKGTEYIHVIQKFINNNPQLPFIADAEKRVCELTGVKYYNVGMLREAYVQFDKAGGKYALSPENHKIFDQCEEFAFFGSLSPYSDEREIRLFLAKYPSGKYYNDVSNYLAIQKAEELTLYSDDKDFNEALSYAKDETTRSIVNDYIKDRKMSFIIYSNKNSKRLYKSDKRIRLVTYIASLGINSTSFDENNYQVSFYCDAGLGLKFGTDYSVIQYEFGTYAGIFDYTKPGDDILDSKTNLHLSLFAKLRLNMFSTGPSSKFYVCGTGYLNALTNWNAESPFAISGGVGIRWTWFDLAFILRKDIISSQSRSNSFIGASCAINIYSLKDWW